MGARFGLGVVVVFVSARCGSVGDIHECQCVSRHVVRVSHGCVGVRVQSFSVLVVPLGSERQLLSNKPFFLQWHVYVSYCGVIVLNMGSLEEAVVVLPFVLIPCSSLHCARVFRRG